MGSKRRKASRQPQYESEVFHEIQARVAAAVRSLRKKAKISQEEAAHRCEMSTRLLQQVESAEANLTLTTLARLCEGFEVDISRLVRKVPKGRTSS